MASPFNNLKKLRELDSNKVMFVADDHTPEKPHTVTVTSVLPTPKKGNPGTLRTIISHHKTVTLDEGLANERTVPVVTKLETSFPIGSKLADQLSGLAFLQAIDFSVAGVDQDLFASGILPKD